MVKNIINLLLLLFVIFHISCSPAKPAATVKLNDIDSVIRLVNADHNCGCNWGDQYLKIYNGGSFAKYNYFYNTVYLKSVDSFDILNGSKKIKEQMLKLEPSFNEYNRFFLEYRIKENNIADTSIKFKVIGTWYNFKNGCSGFIKDMNAKKLIKKTAMNSYKEKLCK